LRRRNDLERKLFVSFVFTTLDSTTKQIDDERRVQILVAFEDLHRLVIENDPTSSPPMPILVLQVLTIARHSAQ
jgi:hypothetical protein